jgi:hypothetical protein
MRIKWSLFDEIDRMLLTIIFSELINEDFWIFSADIEGVLIDFQAARIFDLFKLDFPETGRHLKQHFSADNLCQLLFALSQHILVLYHF